MDTYQGLTWKQRIERARKNHSPQLLWGEVHAGEWPEATLMTPLEARAFLFTWNQLVLAMELHDSIMYQDWLALWEFYGLATPRQVAFGQ